MTIHSLFINFFYQVLPYILGHCRTAVQFFYDVPGLQCINTHYNPLVLAKTSISDYKGILDKIGIPCSFEILFNSFSL